MQGLVLATTLAASPPPLTMRCQVKEIIGAATANADWLYSLRHSPDNSAKTHTGNIDGARHLLYKFLQAAGCSDDCKVAVPVEEAVAAHADIFRRHVSHETAACTTLSGCEGL